MKDLPPLPRRILSAMFRCLDEAGNLTEELYGLEINEEIAFTFLEPLRIRFTEIGGSTALNVGARAYLTEPGIVDHVGTMCWRHVPMTPAYARALVADLLRAGHVQDSYDTPGMFDDLVDDADRARRLAKLKRDQSEGVA